MARSAGKLGIPVEFPAVWREASYYPGCKYAQPWSTATPVLVLHGDIDDVAPLGICKTLFEELETDNLPVLRVYEKAHHAFDFDRLPPKTQYTFGTIGYNPNTKKAAWAEVTAFLRRLPHHGPELFLGGCRPFPLIEQAPQLSH